MDLVIGLLHFLAETLGQLLRLGRDGFGFPGLRLLRGLLLRLLLLLC